MASAFSAVSWSCITAGHLIIIGHAREIIHIGRLGRGRIEADIALRRGDRVVVARASDIARRSASAGLCGPIARRDIASRARRTSWRRSRNPAPPAGEALIIDILGRNVGQHLGLVFLAGEQAEAVGDAVQISARPDAAGSAATKAAARAARAAESRNDLKSSTCHRPRRTFAFAFSKPIRRTAPLGNMRRARRPRLSERDVPHRARLWRRGGGEIGQPVRPPLARSLRRTRSGTRSQRVRKIVSQMPGLPNPSEKLTLPRVW